MRVAAHVMFCSLERDRLEFSRQLTFIFLAEPGVPLVVPGCFIPKFELVALPDQNCVLLERGEIPQLSRHENAAVRIHVDLGRITDHNSYYSTCDLVHAGEADELSLQFFPVR